jgi:CMP-N,N'-diacetyllegionaminic acid synthase
MYCGKKILAIIPARGGSKGIPLKNLTKFKKKNLIENVKICLDNLKIKIDRVILSSDHKKIIQQAKKLKIDVPFVRPAKLSGDKVPIAKVLLHALNYIEKKDKLSYDILVVLEPTCPLREPNHIEKALKKLIKEKKDSVWSVSETDSKYHPFKQLYIKNNKLKFFSKKMGKKIIARQQLNKIFHRNGAVYALSIKYFKKTEEMIGKNTGYIICNKYLTSIDSVFDLKYSEWIKKSINE